jgi:hypothetical protein
MKNPGTTKKMGKRGKGISKNPRRDDDGQIVGLDVGIGLGGFELGMETPGRKIESPRGSTLPHSQGGNKLIHYGSWALQGGKSHKIMYVTCRIICDSKHMFKLYRKFNKELYYYYY